MVIHSKCRVNCQSIPSCRFVSVSVEWKQKSNEIKSTNWTEWMDGNSLAYAAGCAYANELRAEPRGFISGQTVKKNAPINNSPFGASTLASMQIPCKFLPPANDPWHEWAGWQLHFFFSLFSYCCCCRCCRCCCCCCCCCCCWIHLAKFDTSARRTRHGASISHHPS